MSSCRGIIVAGVTNRARTQMAEGFLRTFANNALFVCSGALHHGGDVHPFAVRAMADVGIDVARQSSASLEGARRQRSTYDVYVGIDAPYTDRASDRYQRRDHLTHGEGGSAASASPSTLYSDPLLASSLPSHWTVAQDTTDNRQSWTLWSPRDPSIYHENSTRKLQDHLYEGEPLFMRVLPSLLRRGCRVQRRWEVAEVTQRFAMETEAEQFARFVRAHAQLAPLCVELIKELERVYGECLLDAAAVAAYETAALKSAAAATAATAASSPHKSSSRPAVSAAQRESH